MVECERLGEFVDSMTDVTRSVVHATDPLRARMERHGVPWDLEALVDLRWAIMAPTTALMRETLAQTAQQQRSAPRPPVLYSIDWSIYFGGALLRAQFVCSVSAFAVCASWGRLCALSAVAIFSAVA